MTAEKKTRRRLPELAKLLLVSFVALVLCFTGQSYADGIRDLRNGVASAYAIPSIGFNYGGSIATVSAPGALSGMLSGVTGWMAGVSSSISSFIGKASGYVTGITGNITGILGTLSSGLSGVMSTLSTISRVTGKVSGVLSSLGRIVPSVGSAVAGIISSVSGMISTVSSAISGISSATGGFSSALNGLASGLTGVFSAANGPLSAISNFANSISNGISSLTGKLTGLYTKIMNVVNNPGTLVGMVAPIVLPAIPMPPGIPPLTNIPCLPNGASPVPGTPCTAPTINLPPSSCPSGSFSLPGSKTCIPVPDFPCIQGAPTSIMGKNCTPFPVPDFPCVAGGPTSFLGKSCTPLPIPDFPCVPGGPTSFLGKNCSALNIPDFPCIPQLPPTILGKACTPGSALNFPCVPGLPQVILGVSCTPLNIPSFPCLPGLPQNIAGKQCTPLNVPDFPCLPGLPQNIAGKQCTPLNLPNFPCLPGLPQQIAGVQCTPFIPCLPGGASVFPGVVCDPNAISLSGILGTGNIPLPSFISGFNVPPTALCDPQMMDAMDARGYLEAQREVAMNQSLIVKPDSVLEYTCYDQLMNDFADPTDVPALYSNFGCADCLWVDPSRLFNLQADILSMILSAMYPYIVQNHFHTTFLSQALPASGFVGTRTNVTFAAGFPLQSYACDYMNKIWDQAKCANFAEQNQDGFFDFAHYATSITGSNISIGNDPRTFFLSGGHFVPNTCISPILNIPYLGDIQVATNNNENKYVLPTENPWSLTTPDAQPYDDDRVTAYSSLILPVGMTLPGGGTITCAAPVPTGVCVSRRQMDIYPDAVCPNPGCHYEPQATGNCNIPAGGLPASWCRP